MTEVKLRQLAHCRTGDKGNTANVAIIAYDPRDYPLLEEQVTGERIRAVLGSRVRGEITRYCLPTLGALNFVLGDALTGGVTRSLALDPHGKCISGLILDLELSISQTTSAPAAR